MSLLHALGAHMTTPVVAREPHDWLPLCIIAWLTIGIVATTAAQVIG